MRSITKQGGGGFHLARAHANPPATPRDATTRWGNFQHGQYVKNALLGEQYHLCCYSEIRADQLGLGYHIEHVENKSQNPRRTFDYSNLAASALDSANDLGAFKARGDEVFGGHTARKQGKPDLVDIARFISPHQTDCRRFFAYLSNGRIEPAVGLTLREADQAQYTIDTLNLNSPYLITLRQTWWDELDQIVEQHQAEDWSLEHLASVDLVPTGGKLSRFFSLTRQFFGPVAEHVLQTQAPALV